MDIDYTWNNPTPEQLSALKYVEQQLYGQELPETIPLTHHQIAVMESSYRASAAEVGIYPALSEHELAEFVLMAPGSFWYHSVKYWAAGDVTEITGEAVRALTRGSQMIVRIVERGFQDGKWWDTAALWPDTTRRAIALVSILEVAHIRKCIADRTMYITGAGLNEFVKLVIPGINLNTAFKMLENEKSSLQLVAQIKKTIDKDFANQCERARRAKRAAAHDTYEPTKCIKPDCQSQVAPAGVKPRDGHFANYRGLGACNKAHNTYKCSKCNLVHSWTTKIGEAHAKHYAGDNVGSKDHFGDKDTEYTPPAPRVVNTNPWEDWKTFMASPVVPLRISLKRQLAVESSGHLVCPFCEHRTANPIAIKGTASELHEIFCPTIKGGKYDPKPGDPIAKAVYVLENLILACHKCNMEWLNSQPREWVLSIKMGMPGYPPNRVIPKILDLACTLKYPNAMIPYTLYGPVGEAYRLDFKEFTYQEITCRP